MVLYFVVLSLLHRRLAFDRAKHLAFRRGALATLTDSVEQMRIMFAKVAEGILSSEDYTVPTDM